MATREPPLPAILSHDSSVFRTLRRVGGNGGWAGQMKDYQKMKISHRCSNRDGGTRGFSLLEMMIVIAIIMIVGGMGFMAVQPALKDARVNQAFESAMMPLRAARQRAIAERKQYIVCYGIAAPGGRSDAAGRAHRAKHPDLPLGCRHRALSGHAGHCHHIAAGHSVSNHRRRAQRRGHGAGRIRQRHGCRSILIRMSPAGESRTRSCSCPTVRRMTSTEI